MNSFKKSTSAAFMMAVLVTCLGVSSAYAGGDKCCYKKDGKEMSLEQKFYKKVKFVSKHEDELALTEEQKKTIKDIKTALKKSLIEQEAKVETVKLDIHAGLYERPVNVDALNTLVDQKYEAKKAASKSLIKAFADFKNVFTDQQYETMKKLWKEKYDKKDKD